MTDLLHFSVRVYYEDTDFSGNVYHANYLKYCERARSDYLRVMGIDQNAMFARGEAFVVRRMNCEFLRPAKFEDMLDVETRLIEMSGARFELEQVVKRGAETLFSTSVTVAVVDASGRPKRISSEIAAALSN